MGEPPDLRPASPNEPPLPPSLSSSVVLERLPPSPTPSLSDTDASDEAPPPRRGLKDIARMCVGIASVKSREAERVKAYHAAADVHHATGSSVATATGAGVGTGAGAMAGASPRASTSAEEVAGTAAGSARWWPRGAPAPQHQVTLSVGMHAHARDPFAKEVAVKGWQVVGGKSWTDGAKLGAYVVYDIDISLRSGTTVSILRRYTEFVRLRDDLNKTFPHLKKTIPPLPGKNHMAKFDPKFLEERRPRLQRFLRTVMLHPEMGVGGDDSVLARWVLKH